MFLYRDKYYDNSTQKPEIEDAEVIIAKNRQGATRTVMVKWWAKRTLFFEPDLQGAPPESGSDHYPMPSDPPSSDLYEVPEGFPSDDAFADPGFESSMPPEPPPGVPE